MQTKLKLKLTMKFSFLSKLKKQKKTLELSWVLDESVSINICLKKLLELNYPDNMWCTPLGCSQYACEHITRTSEE